MEKAQHNKRFKWSPQIQLQLLVTSTVSELFNLLNIIPHNSTNLQ